MQPGDLSVVLPEILLSVFAMAGLLIGAYGGKDKLGHLMLWATAALMFVLAFWIGAQGAGTAHVFGGMLTDDAFARFGKVTILLAAAAILLMSESYMAKRNLLHFEFPLLIALAAVSKRWSAAGRQPFRRSPSSRISVRLPSSS